MNTKGKHEQTYYPNKREYIHTKATCCTKINTLQVKHGNNIKPPSYSYNITTFVKGKCVLFQTLFLQYNYHYWCKGQTHRWDINILYLFNNLLPLLLKHQTQGCWMFISEKSKVKLTHTEFLERKKTSTNIQTEVKYFLF